MTDFNIDIQRLEQFEKGLDPQHPETNEIPAHVLGYGELSTVFEIGAGGGQELVYKRMPNFLNEEEALRYEKLQAEYVAVLANQVGLHIALSETVRIIDPATGRAVVYIVQEKLPAGCICNDVIHDLSAADVNGLVLAILREIKKVFEFNQQQAGELAVGLDGQISNWAINGYDTGHPGWESDIDLIYFDTGAPIIRKKNLEQLDPEIFLRAAPAFLTWILKRLFLEDILNRYYDFRQVVIDLVANFYKEQRPDLVSGAVKTVNLFAATEAQDLNLTPISEDEVRSFYREDALIWSLFLSARRIDRTLHKMLRRDYSYILPGKINR